MVDDVLEVLPGPDFPGGGQIISNKAEIRTAYDTGRGSIAMRARWHVEPLARGQWRIVVDELPHGVSCRQVLEEIEALVNPKPAFGKKDVTQEQKRIKQFVLDIVETVRDESDRKSRMRIIIEPRSSRQDADEMMKALLVHTSLEMRYPLNLTWLGFLDGLPDTKGIVGVLQEWTEFRIATVKRGRSIASTRSRTACTSWKAASRLSSRSTRSSSSSARLKTSPKQKALGEMGDSPSGRPRTSSTCAWGSSRASMA